jgi:hypothetical protein
VSLCLTNYRVAWVRPRLRSCGICGEKSDIRASFLRVNRFPLPPFHRLLHTHHHPLSGTGTIGLIVADVPSGLNLPHRVEISNRFSAFENLHQEVGINSAWETSRENIKISTKKSLILDKVPPLLLTFVTFIIFL